MNSSASNLKKDKDLAALSEVAPKVDSVDQIRDILFGVQMGEYETRFRRLEERLVKENQSLRDKLEQRIETVLNELKDERGQRQSEIKNVTGKITDTAAQLGQVMNEAQKAHSSDILQVRDELHDQGKQFEQSLDDQGSGLAGLLRELADKLENQPA